MSHERVDDEILIQIYKNNNIIGSASSGSKLEQKRQKEHKWEVNVYTLGGKV